MSDVGLQPETVAALHGLAAQDPALTTLFAAAIETGDVQAFAAAVAFTPPVAAPMLSITSYTATSASITVMVQVGGEVPYSYTMSIPVDSARAIAAQDGRAPDEYTGADVLAVVAAMPVPVNG